jgi:hypothetical protein
MEDKISIRISSPHDRKKLVAEIFMNNYQFGEINNEENKLVIEIYPNNKNGNWKLNLSDLKLVLKEAEDKLKENL